MKSPEYPSDGTGSKKAFGSPSLGFFLRSLRFRLRSSWRLHSQGLGRHGVDPLQRLKLRFGLRLLRGVLRDLFEGLGPQLRFSLDLRKAPALTELKGRQVHGLLLAGPVAVPVHVEVAEGGVVLARKEALLGTQALHAGDLHDHLAAKHGPLLVETKLLLHKQRLEVPEVDLISPLVASADGALGQINQRSEVLLHGLQEHSVACNQPLRPAQNVVLANLRRNAVRSVLIVGELRVRKDGDVGTACFGLLAPVGLRNRRAGRGVEQDLGYLLSGAVERVAVDGGLHLQGLLPLLAAAGA